MVVASNTARTVHRIVTGHDEQGDAIFLSDSESSPVEVKLIPGYKTHELWSLQGDRSVPHLGSFPGVPRYFPSREGVVFRIVEFPPMSETGVTPVEITEDTTSEIADKLPGFVDHLELDNPGMHTTSSIDFGIVISGEMFLELDNGEERLLTTGDCVIQNGTRHAWRNRSGNPVMMAFVLLGAERVSVSDGVGEGAC